MSTRTNVIIESKKYNEKLYFYRHSDGYPEGTLPTLQIFMDWLKRDIIRDNVPQSAGWLIMLGAIEYNTFPEYKLEKPLWEGHKPYGDIQSIQEPKDWKIGAYEPTTGMHGDIAYLYIINLDNKTLICKEAQYDLSGEWGDPDYKTFKEISVDAFIDQVLKK